MQLSVDNPFPLDLPQGDADWFFSLSDLETHSELLPEPTGKRWLLAVIDLQDEILLKLDILGGEPDTSQMIEFIYKAISQPDPAALSEPQRPKKIWVADPRLVEMLFAALAEIQVPIAQTDPPPSIQQILDGLDETFSLIPPVLPGILSVPGFTPQGLQSLCAAAADFYRAAPWTRLSDVQPLSVTIHPPDEEFFVQLMGAAGLEFGLVFYKGWHELEQFYQSEQDPLAHIPDSGWRSLTFESNEGLPVDDLLAFEKYDCEIAGEEAYPLPAIYTPDALLRPGIEELQVFEIILRALPEFVEAYLVFDEQGEYQSAQMQTRLRAGGMDYQVAIKYPAKEPAEMGPAYRSYVEDQQQRDQHELDHAFRKVAPSRLKSDFQLAGLFSAKEEKTGPDLLENARRLIHMAWEEEDPTRRIALAEQALQVSPDCPEAYLLLAEEDAADTGQAYTYFQKAMQVSEQNLGAAYFEEHAGEFWKRKETRPYMRARRGMADCLVALNEADEAQEHYLELLRLNPDDDQGVRYAVMPLLLRKGSDQQAWQILQQYQGDDFAAWFYTSALLAFRKSGDCEESRRYLREAVQRNPHAPDLLVGRKPIPEDIPSYMGYGDESEAIHYAVDCYPIWWSTRGAIDWLKQQGGSKD